jgi:hypothetical protein
MIMTAYNSRQFAKMRQQIRAYEETHISLNALIGDLTFLMVALEEIDGNWGHRFSQAVVDLESVNAYMLEKGIDSPDEFTSTVVSKAIAELVKLIP